MTGAIVGLLVIFVAYVLSSWDDSGQTSVTPVTPSGATLTRTNAPAR